MAGSPCRRGAPPRAGRRRSAPAKGSRSTPARTLTAGPRGHAEAPQPDEPLGVLVAEGVGSLVGGQRVVVEADVAAATGDDAAPGQLAAQAHLPGDELLAGVDERVERLLEGGEPQAVVDELGVARLEARLLVGEVALEGEV